jgi:hypothetical protein
VGWLASRGGKGDEMATAIKELDLQDRLLEGERIKQSRFWSFIRIIKAQHEAEPPELGSSQVMCEGCEVVTKKRMSIENFAEFLSDEGWAILNVANASVLCPVCQNIELAEPLNDTDARIDAMDDEGRL